MYSRICISYMLVLLYFIAIPECPWIMMPKEVLEPVPYGSTGMYLFQFKNDTVVRFLEHYHRAGNL